MTTISQEPAAIAEPRQAKRQRTRNNGKHENRDEGTKESPNDKISRRAKRIRAVVGEEFEEPAVILAANIVKSAAASPDGPSMNPDKESQSIGEEISHTKKGFNDVLHNRLVSQRRKIDELRMANKDKDRIINQYKTMWAKEKDKNQQLVDRLQEIEKKVASMTRPLQRSIKSMMTASSFPATGKAMNSPSGEHASTITGH